MKKGYTLLLVLFMVFALCGCSAKSVATEAGNAYAPQISAAPMENAVAADKSEIAYDQEMPLTDDMMMEQSVALPENRKLIQTVRINAETEDMDALLSQVNDRIAALSGYIGNQNIYNGSSYSKYRSRNAELTVRIPADRLNEFVEHVGTISNVVSSSMGVDDITLNYVATESRMKALQAEEARLLEFMEMAKTMDELLTVEKYLTDVRTELEQVTAAMRVMDNQVDYATVYLNISEVQEYTVVEKAPKTVGERIREGFGETLEDMGEGITDFAVYIVVNLPYILLLGAGVAAVVLLLARRKRKRKSAAGKKQKALPDNQEENEPKNP